MFFESGLAPQYRDERCAEIGSGQWTLLRMAGLLGTTLVGVGPRTALFILERMKLFSKVK